MMLLPLLFCRGECLEEQLNDLIELYQSEILNLKEELASMEEKTAHQSLDSVTDIHVSVSVFFPADFFYVISRKARVTHNIKTGCVTFG